MHLDTNTLTLIGFLITAVGGPIMGEWRATRLRAWVQSQHATTNIKLDGIEDRVCDVGVKADAAYHEANGVNMWRQNLTESLYKKQDVTLSRVDEVKLVTQDTNRKVDVQLQRPDMPALVILPMPPAHNE